MEIRNAFRNGVEGYTPATMWFTSGNINKKEMTYQIEGFHDKNIKDFFIHPSSHTQGDYLGEHFFSMIRHAAAEAKRLGSNFWIYDEYNWPSGTAAGQVLVEEPWTHNSCLSRLTKTAKAGETVRLTLPPKATHNTIPLLFTAGDAVIEPLMEGDTVVWTNTSHKEVTLEAYFSRWEIRKVECLESAEVVEENAFGYLDVLDKEAVGVFIKKTHEAYKAQIGEGFGDYVKGIFTDEVSTMPQAFGEQTPEYPWSRLFPQKFMERNGYDIRPRVKDLLDHTDDKLAVDYWETVTDLFMEAYVGQCQSWCEENGLIFTGHLLLEEGIDSTVCRSGDPYEYYKRFTWPGIDTILTYYCIDDYNYNITPKKCSSAAYFLGKERVLSETYTVSGWEIRLKDMKRIFNRLALLGINFLQYMGSKYEFSPARDSSSMTNNWQNPLFRHYGELSRYVSGIQYLVANTKPVAETLMLYPMTTARITLPTLPLDHFGDSETDATIHGVVNALLNLNVPFEVAFEQMIEESEVRGGRLVFKDGAYSTVILPATTHLREATFLKLQQFAEQGGHIIAVNGKPETVIGETAYPAPALPNAVCYECRNYERYCLSETPFLVGDHFRRGPMREFTDRLSKALNGRGKSVADLVPCDGMMSCVREKDGTYYIMVINDNKFGITAKGEMLLDLPFRAINTETGDLKTMKTDDKSFELELAAFECVVLEVSAAVQMQESSGNASKKSVLELKNVTFAPDGANTALPTMYQVRGDSCAAIIEAKNVLNPKRVCDLAASIPQEELVLCKSAPCFYNPTVSQTDWFGWTPVDMKGRAPGDTVVCVYDFTVDEIPEVLELVSDPEYSTVWYLNNEQLYPSAVRRVWHYANPIFDLTGIAKVGTNRLVSICTLPSYKCGFPLPCAVLKGSFRFFEDQILTQKPGGSDLAYWNKQGYLCYTGDGTYTGTFTAPDSGRVMLEITTPDTVEVWANGKQAAKRLWAPYEAELTDFLIPGENKLELRVTSTLSNLLYTGTPSGLEAVKIWTE